MTLKVIYFLTDYGIFVYLDTNLMLPLSSLNCLSVYDIWTCGHQLIEYNDNELRIMYIKNNSRSKLHK